MVQFVAFEEASRNQFMEGGSLRTPFLNHYLNHKTHRPTDQDMNVPVAFLSQGAPSRVLGPHFHHLDEFIVIAGGSGKFGRNEVKPYSLFFARAYTAYGPIEGDSETGIGFFVLFARFDPGAEYLPGSMQKLKQVAGRRPLQCKRQLEFPTLPQAGAVVLEAIPGFIDDRGLAAYTLNMGPEARTVAPDHSAGDGQYILVINGGMRYRGSEGKKHSLVWLAPDDGEFEIVAGPEGLQAIIMNYPKVVQYSKS